MTNENINDKNRTKNKKRVFRGIPLRIEINEDIEFELNKVCAQRKITISRLAYEIFKEWVENEDLKKFDEVQK